MAVSQKNIDNHYLQMKKTAIISRIRQVIIKERSGIVEDNFQHVVTEVMSCTVKSSR